MSIEPDKVICTILAEEMQIDPTRVVVYDQNFKPPTDDLIYIIVSGPMNTKIIGSTNKFAPSEVGPPAKNDRGIKRVTTSETYNVEITSKNTDAKLRRFEVNSAMVSTFSVQKQEENQMSIFRASQNIDLSFIEGGSSLHRYRIPVIINSMKVYEKDITTFNSFQEPEVLADE